MVMIMVIVMIMVMIMVIVIVIVMVIMVMGQSRLDFCSSLPQLVILLHVQVIFPAVCLISAQPPHLFKW